MRARCHLFLLTGLLLLPGRAMATEPWRGMDYLPPAPVLAPDRAGATLQPWVEARLWGSDPPRQFGLPHLDPREAGVDDALAVQLGLRLRADLRPGLTAHAGFRFDSSPAGDPWRRTREFDQLGAANNLDVAWLQYRERWGQLALGRMPLRWGHGLALSGHAPPMDLAMGRLQLGRHSLQAFAGQLSDGVGGQTRYLYGHRAEFRPARAKFVLGFSELALVAGQGLQLRWLNPVSFYAQVQAEGDGSSGRQANVLHSIDIAWAPHERLQLSAELAVDDLQLDREARREKPDQLAWRLGGSVQVHRRLRASYEYRRVDSWTYVHRGEGTNWQSYGVPLGAPEGPDSDIHKLMFDSSLPARLDASVELSFRRRGAVYLDSTGDARGHAGEPFPRPPGEEWTGAGLVLGRQLGPKAQATLGVAWHSIDRDGGEDEEVLEGWLALKLFGPRWSWRSPDAW